MAKKRIVENEGRLYDRLVNDPPRLTIVSDLPLPPADFRRDNGLWRPR